MVVFCFNFFKKKTEIIVYLYRKNYGMMYFLIVLAFLTTFLWIDTLVVTAINAHINPYQKSDEDKKQDKYNAIKRTICIILASLSWSLVLVFG